VFRQVKYVYPCVNPAFATLCGAPASELRGSHWLDRVPLFRDAAAWTYQAVPASQQTQLRGADGPIAVNVRYARLAPDAGGLGREGMADVFAVDFGADEGAHHRFPLFEALPARPLVRFQVKKGVAGSSTSFSMRPRKNGWLSLTV